MDGGYLQLELYKKKRDTLDSCAIAFYNENTPIGIPEREASFSTPWRGKAYPITILFRFRSDETCRVSAVRGPYKATRLWNIEIIMQFLV